MKLEHPGALIEIDPRLVEESLLFAVDGIPPEDRRSFRAQRDGLYEMPPGDERERRFRDLHGEWFAKLRLGETLIEAISERAETLRAVSRALLLPAISSKDEAADLHDDRARGESSGDTRPVLVIRVRPRTLLDEEALLALLRHELLHVADMIDPSFGYSREFPPLGGGPSHENLVRQRYQALWDLTIDGRLQAQGFLPEGKWERACDAFTASFPVRSAEAEEFLARCLRGERPAHEELVRLAIEGALGRCCSLCRLPSGDLRTLDPRREPAVVALIRGDFPGWEPAGGVCPQCADLYAARCPQAAPVAVV